MRQTSMIPVNEPLLDGNEKKYLDECVDSGWISSEGPFVKRFEGDFADGVGRKRGVAVANGTAALEIAVEALGIGLGDEVILPSFTIISCAAAIVKTGATPVVVDSDPATWNMDPAKVAEAVTPRAKAIMAVHIYGLPVDMDPILEIARDHGLKVIEDAAQAIGQTYGTRPCGGFGDVSVFSFYPNKHVTTGEGGMIVTNDDELADKCVESRNLCFQKGFQRFVHERLGWNYRMTNLQAAVGCAQLEKLERSIRRKREIGLRYLSNLSGIDTLELPLDGTEYAENLFWVFGFTLKDECPVNPEELAAKLREAGIATRPFFWPIHEQPVFKKMGLFGHASCPVAERLARRGLYAPSGLAITNEQIDAVSEAIKKTLS